MTHFLSTDVPRFNIWVWLEGNNEGHLTPIFFSKIKSSMCDLCILESVWACALTPHYVVKCDQCVEKLLHAHNRSCSLLKLWPSLKDKSWCYRWAVLHMCNNCSPVNLCYNFTSVLWLLQLECGSQANHSFTLNRWQPLFCKASPSPLHLPVLKPV